MKSEESGVIKDLTEHGDALALCSIKDRIDSAVRYCGMAVLQEFPDAGVAGGT